MAEHPDRIQMAETTLDTLIFIGTVGKEEIELKQMDPRDWHFLPVVLPETEDLFGLTIHFTGEHLDG